MTKDQKITTLEGGKLNGMVSLLVLPMVLLVNVPFVLLYGWGTLKYGIHHVLTWQVFLLLLFGVVVHEGLHALAWLVFLKGDYKQISFGFNLSSFSPYTHCKKPMPVWQYRLGGLLPGLIMGIIPAILSLIFGWAAINFIALLFLWAAGADFLSLWYLRKIPGDKIIQDHPDEMGFIVLDRE